MFGLIRRYWNELVSYEGGLAIVLMDALLVVPLIMAAFFYPLEVLILVGVVLLVSLAGWEGYLYWRRRHGPRLHT